MVLKEQIKKEDLEKLIFIDNVSYREIGRKYGVSDTYIKKICNQLDIKLIKRKTFPEGWVPSNKGKKKPKICENCKNDYYCSYDKSKFCGKDCEMIFRRESHYKYYLSNQESFCGKIHEMKFVKKFILVEQDKKCNICGCNNEWCNNILVFILDHIDGDASNNRRNNLRLICPNCDSQTDTYKSKNKNSARKERYLKNYKN